VTIDHGRPTRADIVCLTTVHPRHDGRIYEKEARSLAERLGLTVVLMVADGNGHVVADRGGVSFYDLGAVGGRLRRALAGPWRALLAIRRLKPEIVHFHDPELIPLGFILRALGIKVIYDVHEDVPRQILTKHWLPTVVRRPIAAIVSLVEWIGGRTFHAIVAATAAIARRFPPSKTVTVQNYPLVSDLSAPSANGARSAHFVYPGVIADTRGAVEMVRAIELLSDVPEARLELAGIFFPSDYSDRLRSLPGWKSVIYRGSIPRDEVMQMLATAHAGLVVHHPIPNEVEAQPVKMYEYMASGLPIIASDFPRWREIIEASECGLVVDPLDPRAIAAAMRWTLEHPREAREMGERGREAVKRGYNWAVEVVKLLDVYRGLLSPMEGTVRGRASESR
jgi:glycosyltransferase involved in cell wall biosynthesis